jgi:hypothetical protein
VLFIDEANPDNREFDELTPAIVSILAGPHSAYTRFLRHL